MSKRFIIIIIIFQFGTLMAQPKPSKEQLIAKWKSIFGNINFSNEVLFEAMVYVGPQPDDSLTSFAGKKLDKDVKWLNKEWLTQFLKKPFHPNFDSLKPKAYYLPRYKEAGFLFYTWSYKKYQLSMYESYNAVLLSVNNDSIPDLTTLSTDNFASLLLSVVNTRSKNITSFKDEFRLSGPVAPGLVFTNIKGAQLGAVRDWEDYIIVFITEHDINVICFKSSNMRAELGLHYVSDWLNSAIIDEKK